MPLTIISFVYPTKRLYSFIYPTQRAGYDCLLLRSVRKLVCGERVPHGNQDLFSGTFGLFPKVNAAALLERFLASRVLQR